MSSFRKKNKISLMDKSASYHVVTQKNKKKQKLKLPKIVNEKDAAEVRQFLFEKAVESFNNDNKNKMISFNINPKDIEPNVVGDRFSGRYDLNRQTHFIATNFISKDTVVEEVEQALDFMKPRNVDLLGEEKNVQYDGNGARIFTPEQNAAWDHATYWNNHWLEQYRLSKNDPNVIGFALVSGRDNDQSDHYMAVRPNDVVFNVVSKTCAYFNENTHDILDNQLIAKTGLEIKKQKYAELAV